jgi:uncharacterized protein (DUF3820 family)
MFNPSTYTPRLFIGIGETTAFYTLRETYLHAIPGAGPWGNAIMNGVYQGTFEERSYHVKNLSQDPDEAFAKAEEAAAVMGLRLTTTRDSLETEMRDIKRANAEEMAKREAVRLARAEALAAQHDREEEQLREVIRAGFFPFGKYCGQHFSEADRGFITWLLTTTFEAGTIMEYLSVYVRDIAGDMALPAPVKDLHIGTVGKRQEFDVVVIRSMSFISEYNGFRVYITIMVDKETGACLKVKSEKFSAEAGEEFRIKATVKAHEEYKGQAQTVIQRVAVL